jgi:hypothetical protein
MTFQKFSVLASLMMAVLVSGAARADSSPVSLPSVPTRDMGGDFLLGDNIPESFKLAVPFAVNDKLAQQRFFTALALAAEGVKSENDRDGDGDFMSVSSNYDSGEFCELAASGASLTCEAQYMWDRFNGYIRATFRVEDGKAVELVSRTLTGSY